MYSGFYWIILLLGVSIVAAEQNFTELSTYTAVKPGENVILECRISNKQGLCLWFRDGKPVKISQGKYEWVSGNTDDGDCSLLVRAATLQVDEGQWECHVEPRYYDTEDALSSPPITFEFQVPPQIIRILYKGSLILHGQILTVTAAERSTVVCEARYGNPAAFIEWHLEKKQLIERNQINSSVLVLPRKWTAKSVLDFEANRSSHAKQLTCRVHHQSYPPPHYKDSYVILEVQFPPRVVSVGPNKIVEANLSSDVTLECKAEGNPPPAYRWYYYTPNSSIKSNLDDKYAISLSRQLVLRNVSYSQHGRYICVVTNHIEFKKRSHQSDTITVKVLGPPVDEGMSTMIAWRGSEGYAQATVCADPPPRRAQWLIGNLTLDIPTRIGRYMAMVSINSNGCYKHKLHISDTTLSDGRLYTLLVQNERGISLSYAALIVKVAVQDFIELPTSTEVNPGEDVILKCRISNKKGACSWQRDDKPVRISRGKYEWANGNTEDGNCSLLVRAATLQVDDGQWKCKVASSYHNSEDAISTPPITFVIRVPPQKLKILYKGFRILPGQNLALLAGERATVVCKAKYGNPAAFIEWYLEKKQLTARNQTNSSELILPRKWTAKSVLDLEVNRSSQAKQLTCRVHHPSYPSPHYTDSYVILDVQFPPRVVSVGPNKIVEANLSSDVTLDCKAEGNPPPAYRWYYYSPNSSLVNSNLEAKYAISLTRQLLLQNVSYNQHGRYICVATNLIGSHQSDAITVKVLGPPVDVGMSTIHVWRGSEAQATVRADPSAPPRRTVKTPRVEINRTSTIFAVLFVTVLAITTSLKIYYWGRRVFIAWLEEHVL